MRLLVNSFVCFPMYDALATDDKMRLELLDVLEAGNRCEHVKMLLKYHMFRVFILLQER